MIELAKWLMISGAIIACCLIVAEQYHIEQSHGE